jgi:twitching motility two-component system response regulator PilH
MDATDDPHSRFFPAFECVPGESAGQRGLSTLPTCARGALGFAIPIPRKSAMAKILIVDDSPTETHVLRTLLEKNGHAVQIAADGAMGVEAAKKHLPDLILMDVVMPVLNGFQATRQLSRIPETAHIPVIMVTTKGQETDRSWGLRQGAKEYITKPIDPKDLLAKIKSVLGG